LSPSKASGRPFESEGAHTQGTPELFRFAASEGGIADEWHTDLTFLPRPTLMSILNMQQCPEVSGDTM